MSKPRFGPFCLALVSVALGGCGWFIPLYNTEVGEFELFDVASDLNTPDWLTDTELVATAGYSNQLLHVSAVNASLLETWVIDDNRITRLNDVAASPDKTRVAVTASYKGDAYDPNAATVDEQDYHDILIYTLASGEVTNLTSATGSFHGVSFLSDTVVMYFEFDYSVADQVTNRILRHNLATDVVTAVVENTYALVGGMAQGVLYWWGKACPVADLAFACATQADGTRSFVVLDMNTGEVVLDGFGVTPFAEIMSGDFVDADTVVVVGGSDEAYSLYLYDVATGDELAVYPIDDPRAYRVYGVNVSPDGTLATSHVMEADAEGAFVRNRLLVARIGEAVR